jgi:hypothetical protein
MSLYPILRARGVVVRKVVGVTCVSFAHMAHCISELRLFIIGRYVILFSYLPYYKYISSLFVYEGTECEVRSARLNDTLCARVFGNVPWELLLSLGMIWY